MVPRREPGNSSGSSNDETGRAQAGSGAPIGLMLLTAYVTGNCAPIKLTLLTIATAYVAGNGAPTGLMLLTTTNAHVLLIRNTPACPLFTSEKALGSFSRGELPD